MGEFFFWQNDEYVAYIDVFTISKAREGNKVSKRKPWCQNPSLGLVLAFRPHKIFATLALPGKRFEMELYFQEHLASSRPALHFTGHVISK